VPAVDTPLRFPRRVIGDLKLKPLAAALALLLLPLSAQIAMGQNADNVLKPDYILGAYDVIEVHVLNHPELNQTVQILPGGKITFPEVGEIVAAGKTTRELETAIKTGLEKGRNNVGVNVLVKEVRSRRVRVVGAVKSQGEFELRAPLKLMDVIALAGGLADRPNKIRGRLHRNTKTLTLDLVNANEKPGSDSNIALEPDDIILLDQVEPVYVYVAGQVERPGRFELEGNTTVMSLLLQAGVRDDAAVSKIHVARGTTLLPLPGLRDAIHSGKPNEQVLGFAFKAGDQLFVPLQEERFSVMGMVTKPGVYPVPETKALTAFDALALAGAGVPGQADLAKSGIIRQESGKATMIPVDFDRMLSKRDLSSNPVMRSGDILYVPQKGQKGFKWTDLLSPISALGVLGFRLWR